MRSNSSAVSPISTTAAARARDLGRQLVHVEVLATAAGDQHDRRLEAAQRGNDGVGLRALRVVDEPDAINGGDVFESVLDAT